MKLNLMVFIFVLPMFQLIQQSFSVVNKNKNNYYYNIFLEQGSHDGTSYTQYF